MDKITSSTEWQQSQQPEVVKLRNYFQQIEQMSDPGSYETAIVRMKSIATEALKALQQKGNDDSDGWISVEDRLPEVKVEVMCYQPPNKFISGRETKGRCLPGYLFELEPCERSGYIDLELLGDDLCSLAAGGKFWAFPYICHQNFVTHWQPLPAPPKK